MKAPNPSPHQDPHSDAIKAVFARNQADTAALARALIREKVTHRPGRVSDRIRSRAVLLVWIGGITVAAVMGFLLANTIGRTLLGLEENLDHHHGYRDARP